MGVDYTTNPNQKIIEIGTQENGRKELCDKEHIYAKINKDALYDAVRDLSPTNFQVWLYLASQKEGYTFAFTPSYITQEYGMTKYGLQEGIRELIKKRYLIQQKENSNCYLFYERPREEKEEEIYITKYNGFVLDNC